MALKQIICIKWGAKYGPDYVNRLYAMAARHVTPPFTFTCFTDDPSGLRPEVRHFPMPEFQVTMPVGTPGMWPKSRLWGPKLGDLEGPVLFLDLDLVITGSLDDFFTHGPADGVVAARNPVRPLERMAQTSIFRFPVGKLEPMQKLFASDPQGFADKYRYEQRFLTHNAPGGVTFFPSAWVRHFRQNCQYPFPLNYAFQPRLPRGTRVVIFPGGLKPHEAVAGTYDAAWPHLSRRQHLAALFNGRRRESFFGHLRHYLLPTAWVSEYWREEDGRAEAQPNSA